jgi:purine nucleosidase
VILEYANGARGMLDLCMFGEGSFDKEILTIVGDEGKIESFLPSQVLRASRRESIGKLSGWKTGAARTPGSEQKIIHNFDVKYMGHHYGASYIEHTKFRDAILNSTPAEVTLKDGVTSVVTGLAAHKSINEGRVVEIKDIGTDVDDALALAVLLGSKEVDLIGITTVYGDAQLRSTIAMHLCSLLNRNIPTFIGESKPMSGREVWMSGSEGKNFKDLDSFTPQATSAIDFLVETVVAQPKSVDVIAIGPLTNIARAIQTNLDFVEKVKRVWIMGGDFTQSRVEHNFKCDVDAARIVLESNIPISILDLPSSQKTIIRMEEIKQIRTAPALGALLYSEIMSWIQPRNQDWTIPHDPIAALTLLAPEFFESSPAGQVKIDSEGMSFWNESPSGNVVLLNPIHPELAVERMIELITN